MPDTSDPAPGTTDLTSDLDWLCRVLQAAATTPEAFDLEVLFGRAVRAVAALRAVLGLADSARPVLTRGPADCTTSCNEGPCDCSGEGVPVGWSLDPAKVRESIRAALAGKEARS